jgi:hypothetical protein
MKSLPALSLCLALAACQGRAADEPPPPPELATASTVADEPVLRTYTVPTGRSEEVSRVLRRALAGGTTDTPPRGTVNALDDGRLVVLAPASVHEGIAGLCEDLEQVGGAPAQPTIAISYWLVLADPAGDGVAASVPSILSPALEEIARQDGAAAFSLLESTKIASLHSAQGEARGRYAEISQLAVLTDGAIVADVDIEADLGSKLKTRLSLAAGELVVLGHAGRQTESGTDARLYYIVRAEAEPSAAE